MAKTKKPIEEPKVITVETFRALDRFEINNFTQTEPSAMNGTCRVIKYKISIERIEEPIEVYSERLNKLWDENDNYHNWDCVRSAANKLGVTLINQYAGTNKNKNK